MPCIRSLILAAAMLAATHPASAESGRLKVVASFSIIADIAAEVGGDRVDITTLVGPDGDAHVFEAGPADAVAVAGADVVLVNGLAFEGFLPRLIAASGTKAPIVELSAGTKPLISGMHGHEEGHEDGQEDDHAHGTADPHAWQSVPNAKRYVANAAAAFCTADPAGCDLYKANAAAYATALDALDAEIRAAIAAIPEDRRTIITAHDAFGHFAAEYGITFLAPEGVATDSEASAADVAAIIAQVKEDKASAVFLENITDPRLIEQIAADAGVTVGGTLFSDALTPPGGEAGTYLAMMRHNIRTISAALAP